jgi:hypothetical protein
MKAQSSRTKDDEEKERERKTRIERIQTKRLG